MTYPKLVRDRIPEIIRASGHEPLVKTASIPEYRELLRAKLMEEVTEFLESENVEELADITEVIYALAKSLDTTVEQLDQIRRDKATRRGVFADRIVWLGNE